MIIRIIRHEVRSLAADRIVWVAFAALVLLTGYAVGVGDRFVRAQERQVEEARADEAERYARLSERLEIIAGGGAAGSPFQDPSRPYTLGRSQGQRSATLPPSPFQSIAVGQSDLAPTVVPVSLDGASPRGAREEIENPIHLLSGPLDLAFLITFLLPLLVIALSYDMLSREREGGTLAILLSQPISPGRLVLGKALARWGLLFAVVTGLAWGALALLASPPPGDRFLLWAGAVGLYLAFWIALAALVNVMGSGSARNAVVLSFAWLVFVILVPAAIQAGASLLHPVPSRAELVGAEREATRVVQEEASAVLARYYEDHPELLPEGSVEEVDFQTRAYAVQDEVNRRTAHLRERYRVQLEGQRGFIRTLRWLSPAILVHHIQLQLAGTGDERLDRFEAELSTVHAEWVAFFGPAIYENRRMTPADLEGIPTWSFRDEETPEVAERAIPALAFLLLLSGGVGALSLTEAKRLTRKGGER